MVHPLIRLIRLYRQPTTIGNAYPPYQLLTDKLTRHLHKLSQRAAAHRVPQLPQRFCFNLADPFSSHF